MQEKVDTFLTTTLEVVVGECNKDILSERQLIAVRPRSVNINVQRPTPLPPERGKVTSTAAFTTGMEHIPATIAESDCDATSLWPPSLRCQCDRQRGEGGLISGS